VDVVQLLGCGVCFGATMVGLVFMLRGTRALYVDIQFGWLAA
jgi:hypothetical protein